MAASCKPANVDDINLIQENIKTGLMSNSKQQNIKTNKRRYLNPEIIFWT